MEKESSKIDGSSDKRLGLGYIGINKLHTPTHLTLTHLVIVTKKFVPWLQVEVSKKRASNVNIV